MKQLSKWQQYWHLHGQDSIYIRATNAQNKYNTNDRASYKKAKAKRTILTKKKTYIDILAGQDQPESFSSEFNTPTNYLLTTSMDSKMRQAQANEVIENICQQTWSSNQQYHATVKDYGSNTDEEPTAGDSGLEDCYDFSLL